jgi:uncharacterized membrane protein YbhN (UPF0104 family)
VRDGVVASIARKWLVMRSHGAYIALGALAGFSALGALSQRVLGSGTLPWIVLASAFVPMLLSAGVRAGLLGNATFARLHNLLARFPSRRLRTWLDAQRQQASATDAQVARLRAAGTALRAASVSFLACWWFEAIEAAVVLHFAGARLGLGTVIAVEAGLSLVRSVAVLAPSGFGIVDLGYAAVLQALGVDPSSAAAFVLLRRGKEALWVAFGFGLLAALRTRSRARSPSVPFADQQPRTMASSPAAALAE